ncbi:hypothetical protein HY745_11200 [Candidatus Desantisbacteria bacterium]|nr:hypothetical protein [Candidatus Desantisbacteria bacterium]
MNKTDQEIKFEKYREYLKSEAQRLWQYISLYNHLLEKTKDKLEELNLAPAFFSTVKDSLFTCIILWTHNLFSKDSIDGNLFDSQFLNTFDIDQILNILHVYRKDKLEE